MRRLLLALALVVCWCALGPDISSAGPILYTFETPQFTVGQTTPLLNQPPNVGPATFTTSFTDAVDPSGYEITNIDQSNLISGQALIAPTATSPLTLTFNTPVTYLSVDFAIDIGTGSPAGFLRLVTPSGTLDQPSSNVGGPFEGGILTFSTAVPFSTATLQGFLPGGTTPTQIEIDNLSLTPEPGTFLLLGSGLAGLAALRWRRRRR